MFHQREALTAMQKHNAGIVADIVKGVPVSEQSFLEVLVSVYTSAFRDGRKAERNAMIQDEQSTAAGQGT